MQEQDIVNRVDTIAKALLKFVKENDVKMNELSKQVKVLEEKIEFIKNDMKDISEANKKISRDIEGVQDSMKDGFYELKAKIGSSLYEIKKEEKKDSIRDMIRNKN